MDRLDETARPQVRHRVRGRTDARHDHRLGVVEVRRIGRDQRPRASVYDRTRYAVQIAGTVIDDYDFHNVILANANWPEWHRRIRSSQFLVTRLSPGACSRVLLKHPLHPRNVNPALEFVPHLALNTHNLEAETLVQPQARRVVARNAGDYRVKAVFGADLHESLG